MDQFMLTLMLSGANFWVRNGGFFDIMPLLIGSGCLIVCEDLFNCVLRFGGAFPHCCWCYRLPFVSFVVVSFQCSHTCLGCCPDFPLHTMLLPPMISGFLILFAEMDGHQHSDLCHTELISFDLRAPHTVWSPWDLRQERWLHKADQGEHVARLGGERQVAWTG